ncbi:hypothetical protein Dimus_034845 [Dionaea muscipula]
MDISSSSSSTTRGGASTDSNISGGGVLVRKSSSGGGMTLRIESPFTLKVGQVFTGFGIGCGLGIGVGRPLNLGAIPVLNQVMSAASGATYAFSGVGRHVNQSLKKLGAKNIEAGIGCGIGFGHGFGVGIALKPGVIHLMQSFVGQALNQLMAKFGVAPNISIDENILPTSLQSGLTSISRPSMQNQLASTTELGSKVPFTTSSGQPVENNWSTTTAHQNIGSQGDPLQLHFKSQSEKLINSFLQNPSLKEDSELSETVGKLQSENRMLHMVLKHQQVIDQLMEENEKLRRILIEDLKIPPSKLEPGHTGRSRFPCEDCVECRRKQRKR